jgi:hypothetical protein
VVLRRLVVGTLASVLAWCAWGMGLAPVARADEFGCEWEPVGPPIVELTAVGGTIFFSSSDRRHGRELWRTDGTRRAHDASGTSDPALRAPGPTR